MPELDTDFNFFPDNHELTAPAPLEAMAVNEKLFDESPAQDLLDLSAITGFDFDSLSELSGAAVAPAALSAASQSVQLSESELEQDAATAEMLEIEALQQQLEAYEMQAAAAIQSVDVADIAIDFDVDVDVDIAIPTFQEPDLLALSAINFDAQFLMPTGSVVVPEALDIGMVQPDQPAEISEQIKVIGDLQISIPLYNVYLNEADEWSRRLEAELSEWAMECRQPIDDSTVSFAHSLAGSSATVGFLSLSEISRALENALLRSQAHFSAKTAGRYSDLFVACAEDIRRLLHQFAAGFLKEADANLVFRLNALDFTLAENDLEPTSGPAALSAEDIFLDVNDVNLPAEMTNANADLAFPIYKDDPVFQAASAAAAPVQPVTQGVTPLSPFSPFSPPSSFSPSVSVVSQFASPVFAPASSPAFAAVFQTVPASAAVQQLGNSDDDIDAIDAIDTELFPIFDEEAAELMPQLGSALRQWSARPDNLSARLEVLRTLHTLKGSARLAGALRLGEMAHRIESEIEFLGSDAAATQDFEPLLTRFDTMQQTLDVLRAGDANAAGQQPEMPVSKPVVMANETIAAQQENIADLLEPAAFQSFVQTQAAPAADKPGFDVAVPASVQAIPGKILIPAPQTMAMQPLRQAATASIRVRTQLLDRMVNQAGEVMITRSRLEVEMGQLRGSLGDMTDNLNRLRQQLRDIELQAETQMQSRLAQAKELQAGFDPLEFDRFTRVQELTRMMAESVNDVATVQRSLQRTVEATEDDLVAQARQTRELQRDLLKTRMVEFEAISDRLYRVVRQASKDSAKQVKLDLLGSTIEMDRGMLDRMTPAFEHLLRNCVAHGIESPAVRIAAGKDAAGLITVHLRQEGNDVSVEFSDDGAGLDLKRIYEKAVSSGLISADQVMDDQQAAGLIFMPGFTTATQITELSGRGIGMDVVRSEVNSVGGRIETTSVAGKGTQFKLVLPLTTAVTQVVMLRSGALMIGVPSNVVEVVRRTTAKEIQQAYNAGSLDVAGEAVPFFWSGALLQSTRQSTETQGKTTSVVIFKSAAQRVALHVDEVLGNQEVVVKNLGPQLSRLPGLAGMSVLASGAVVLIYNPVALASVYGAQARALSADRAEPHMLEAALLSAGQPPQGQIAPPQVSVIPLVMVVDDSVTVRRVTQRLLQRAGYRVVLAADGLQALEKLQEERPSVVLSDIEMPRMDGFDLVRNIRADTQLKDMPIIMITSRIAEKHRVYAQELGVDHYLGKPYPEDELMRLVKQYCSAEVLTA